MACNCPLCGNLHDRPAAAPKTASPATPRGDPGASLIQRAHEEERERIADWLYLMMTQT